VKTGKAAIGKVAFSGREHVIAIKPAEGSRGMIGYTLRYAYELRNQEEYFRDIKATTIDEDSLQLAETLIAKRAAKFDLNKFEDGYEVAVKELVEAKVNKLPVPQDEVPEANRGKVVDLMDALRQSIGSDTAAKPAAKKPPKSEKEPAARRGIGLVKSPAKSSRRKTA
jgi:DNA end-binding protein Ku